MFGYLEIYRWQRFKSHCTMPEVMTCHQGLKSFRNLQGEFPFGFGSPSKSAILVNDPCSWHKENNEGNMLEDMVIWWMGTIRLMLFSLFCDWKHLHNLLIVNCSYIRKIIGQNMKMKLIPELRLIYNEDIRLMYSVSKQIPHFILFLFWWFSTFNCFLLILASVLRFVELFKSVFTIG